MKILVLTDKGGRILSIGSTQVRPAKGKFAPQAEIDRAKTMTVGISPVDHAKQSLHTIDLSDEFAGMPLHELHRTAQVDLSGKTPRITRKR